MSEQTTVFIKKYPKNGDYPTSPSEITYLEKGTGLTYFLEEVPLSSLLPEIVILGKEEIENIIEHIMIQDGPDGHCDGAEIIAEFIMALLKNQGEEWYKNYNKNQ